MVNHLREQNSLGEEIVALENEISNRENNLSPTEAKVFYEHLLILCDRLVENHTQIEKENDSKDGRSTEVDSDERLNSFPKIRAKAISLRAKLWKIFEPAIVSPNSNLESLLRKHESLKKQILSLERSSEPNPTEAEILYNHLTQTYEWFTSNQSEIEKQIHGDALNAHLETFEQFQEKVIGLQIKYKRIFASPASVPSTQQIEPRQHDQSEVNMERLLAIQKSLISEITSVEGRYRQVGGEKEAECLLKCLLEISAKFDANQSEIEKNVEGEVLRLQLGISRRTRGRIIEIQTSMAFDHDERISTEKRMQLKNLKK